MHDNNFQCLFDIMLILNYVRLLCIKHARGVNIYGVLELLRGRRKMRPMNAWLSCLLLLMNIFK
jgi:hypothetical protein